MPPVLSGVPARSVRTDLVLGGGHFWRLGRGRPLAVPSGLRSARMSSLSPSADRTQVSQIVAVTGGVVALMSSASSQAADSSAGSVLFIPAAAPDRLIARASAIAVAPSGRQVWVQTAVQPSSGLSVATSRPVMSPTFALNLAGRRVSPVLRLPLGLIAATSAGLLTDSVVTGQLQIWSPSTGLPERLTLPADARVVGAGSGLVIWQSQSCAVPCPLHVTDLGGRGITVPLPVGWWPMQYQEPIASDASGRRLVVSLARTGFSGDPTAEELYVIDMAARAGRPIPGGPTASSQPLGLGDPGVELAGAWDQRGRLWVLATSRYGYFQLGYWAGAGPLHIYPPVEGSPVAISAPGPG